MASITLKLVGGPYDNTLYQVPLIHGFPPAQLGLPPVGYDPQTGIPPLFRHWYAPMADGTAVYVGTEVNEDAGQAPHVGPYRNWRGEVRVRRILPIKVYFGSNVWHTHPQWLLDAHDLDHAGEVRTFALSGFLGAEPAPGSPIPKTPAAKASEKHGAAPSASLTDRFTALSQVVIRLDDWRQAVIDAGVTNWTLKPEHEDDPRAAVNALICFAQETAHDPHLSAAAARRQDAVQRVWSAWKGLDSVYSLDGPPGWPTFGRPVTTKAVAELRDAVKALVGEAPEAPPAPTPTHDEAWIEVAVEANKALDAYLRSVDPDLPEHYGMPVDGVRRVVETVRRQAVCQFLSEGADAHSRFQRRVEEAMIKGGQTVRGWPTVPAPAERERIVRLCVEEVLELAEAWGVTVELRSVEVELTREGSYRVSSALQLAFTATATGTPDLVKAADAHADLAVVNCGGMSAAGLADGPLLELITEANLRKFDPPTCPVCGAQGNRTVMTRLDDGRWACPADPGHPVQPKTYGPWVREDGKYMKPSGWRSPDVAGLLRKMGAKTDV